MLTTATLFMGNTFSNLYVVDGGCDLLYSRAPQGCRVRPKVASESMELSEEDVISYQHSCFF